MPTATDVTAGEAAHALHAEALVFDGLAIAYVLDERFAQRCLEGGVHAANVTFALEENWDKTLNNFERHLAKIDKSTLLTLCRTADEVVAAKKKGRLGIVIGTQGASMIQEDSEFWRLDLMVRMGLRFLGLAYTTANAFGDGCGEKRDAGLTYLGEALTAREDALVEAQRAEIGIRPRRDLADRIVLLAGLMAEHRLEPALHPEDAGIRVVGLRRRRGKRQGEPCKRHKNDQANSQGHV